MSPRDSLRAWLPHVLLLGLALAALWWLLLVVAPIRDALLMAGSLALLTHPLLFAPFDRWLHRAFPTWSDSYRRYFSSLIATLALTGIALMTVLVALWAIVGSVGGAAHAAIGLVFQDPKQIQFVVDRTADRFADVLQYYPSLGLTPDDFRRAIAEFLMHDRFGPEFLKLLFTGTGGLIVELVLTFTTLFYLYSQGPELARFLLRHLPLSEMQRRGLRLRFHRTVQHLLADTIGKALAIGSSLGLVAWAVAGFQHPLLVGAVGVFAGLMPVVGHAFVWLPLASLLASHGRWTDAWCLAIASWSAVWLIERASQRMARALGTDDTWLSFLLFLSVIGGALGYGARGLVLGPAAVITVVLLAEFLGSLYGRSPEEREGPAA
jgi:predicted PurR-regulated permease PerM